MALVRPAGWLLAALLSFHAGSAAAEPPCANVSCSDHGRCIAERERAYCQCDRGFMAVRQSCVPVPFEAPRRTASGASIVRIARAEVGHDLRSVGSETDVSYPGPLRTFVPEDALWCSDFVSWVYRAAGVPLSGGYEGGWLVTNNNAVRAWFEDRGLWVDHNAPAFRTFDPLPGDYVRVRTATWGHSAIVERVEGDTLHLIEGNAGGRVRAVAYRHFRTHPKIDGFGVVTYPSIRKTWRATPPAHWLIPLRTR